jgi:hypothetical protein
LDLKSAFKKYYYKSLPKAININLVGCCDIFRILIYLTVSKDKI